MNEYPDIGPVFRGRTALVTGAAHGFGREIAALLARRGAFVVAVDIAAGELGATQAVLDAAGAQAQAQFGASDGVRPGGRTETLDVTDEAAVTACIREVVERYGKLDILVNNAGGVLGQVHQPIEDVTPAEWRAVLDVNLTGAFYCIRAAAPSMKARQYGRIVNVSSGAGRSFSLTGIQAYASAKAGQIGLTRQMARELGPYNITVNNVAPGFVRSNPTTEKQWQAMGPEGQAALLASISLRRLGTARDIAEAVCFFASDAARWVSGQVISVDGGHHMF
ncbi:MAG: SDR family oxidoreductase [Alicyclobacillus sp.]|nr:SDR family oxidoreductase [Alicyclobacillus sp.]